MTPPLNLSNVVAIAAGAYHALALRQDGTVAGWGNNFAGQIAVPPGLNNVVAISAGDRDSLAVKADGTVIGWGDWTNVTIAPTGLSNVVAVAGTRFRSLALTAPLSITSIELRERNPVLRIRTFLGQRYSVEQSVDIMSNAWLPLVPWTIKGTGQEEVVVDESPVSAGAGKFYRLRLLPY